MKKLTQVVSEHAASNNDLSKEEHAPIQVEFDGVVEVAGSIVAGEEVTFKQYETPSWLVRTPD